MSEQNPLDELKDIFEKAAVEARKAWGMARERSEAAKQENVVYREIASLGVAAVDALERAIKKAWDASGSK
jgi:kynureninase